MRDSRGLGIAVRLELGWGRQGHTQAKLLEKRFLFNDHGLNISALEDLGI